MTLRRFKRERYILRGHPFDHSSLTGGSHISVIDIKKKKEARSNPKNQPLKQTLRAEAVQSLYNKNYVNAKSVF
jgi:hypothetical protein